MDMPVTIHHIEQCAPSAPASIVEAIIRTESGFNPLAINVNRSVKLARQPASRKEAEGWVRWLLANGYNFDSGLMQINSTNWKKLGLTPENVFDVCENILAGAKLFSENYRRATADFGPGRASLVSAISAYNTGDFNSGVRNGYVSKVVQNAQIGESDIQEIPPLIPAVKTRGGPTNNKTKKDTNAEKNTAEPDPFTAPSTIDGFSAEGLKPWDRDPKPESTPAYEELDAPNPTEPKSSGWRKELSMKTKRLFVTALLAASVMSTRAERTTV